MNKPTSWLALVAITLILVAYFLDWIPHPAAGLTLIGLEVGEWIKFLPGMRNVADPVTNRTWFYLPPITAALALLGLTADWPIGRLQTWLARAIAGVVALLALPQLEVIRDEPSAEWRTRVVWILLVGVAALLVGLVGKRARVVALLWIVVALIGGLLPTIGYVQIRPVIATALQESVGIGVGVWLNLAAHLLLAVAAGWLWMRAGRQRLSPNPRNSRLNQLERAAM